MLHNITQQGSVNVKGAQGKTFRKFPKNLPIKNSCTLTETNVPRVSINEVGTVSFNNTELLNLLNKDNTQVRITLDILYRAPETSQELNKETSTHLKRMYLFSTITNNKLSIDCDGVNIILYIDGSTPKIKTETMNYYKIDIENLTIYKSNDIIYAKSDIWNCIDTSVKTWTQSNITSVNFICCYYANGIWVACSDSNGLYYSTDGKTWTQSNITTGYFDHCYYANGIWVACAQGYGLYYSTDGKTYTQSNITTGHFTHCYYANGIWVACCEDANIGLCHSTDGKNWETGVPYAGANHCYYANGVWVVCCDNGLYYSTDFDNWVSDIPVYFTRCYYSNGIWVACCEDGLYYSTDGKTWIKSNVTSSKFTHCYYANGIWVACNYNNGLYYSQVNQNIVGTCKWGLYSNMPEVSPGSSGNSGIITV